MIELVFGQSKYKVAESWAELTPQQRLELIPFSRLATADITEEFELLACRLWIGVSPKKWIHWKMSRPQWGRLRKQFRWIFSTRPEGQPAKYFDHGGIRYFLPADQYETSTALDVALLNMAYVDFANPDQPNPQALDRLIAIMCRPQRTDLPDFQESDGWNGDVRESWNEPRMMERATSFKSLPLPVKVSLLDYFERMNGPFLEAYSELFGGDKEPRYGDGRGWIMMLKNVAKAGTFGSFEAVCHQPVNLVWASILDDVLENQEEIERQKQQKP